MDVKDVKSQIILECGVMGTEPLEVNLRSGEHAKSEQVDVRAREPGTLVPPGRYPGNVIPLLKSN